MRNLIFISCLLFSLPVLSQGWQFSRSTTAYKTFSNAYENTYPSHSMDEVGVNAVRVSGKGGGVLIEGAVTQLHGLTEAFDSWTQSGTCAVTADDWVAPNGALTVDELDNTGGANTDNRSVLTADLGSLTGRKFTASVWVRAATPHNVTLRLYENPAVGDIVVTTFYAARGLQRYTISGTAAGGGDGTLSFYVYPGERAVATGVAHFWGANLTETTFPTSYIPNPGAATSQVTKTADSLGIDVLEAGTNNRILADVYCQNCAADKITIYGEWKAEWSSSTDIGQDRRLVNMGNASSANNNLELYVSSAGNVFLRFQDNGGTIRTINSAVDPTGFSDWFSIRGVVDFTDLSRSELYIDGVVDHAADSGNWTGGATFDTAGNKIRLGADRTGTVDGFHHTRQLRAANSEIRP